MPVYICKHCSKMLLSAYMIAEHKKLPVPKFAYTIGQDLKFGKITVFRVHQRLHYVEHYISCKRKHLSEWHRDFEIAGLIKLYRKVITPTT